LHAAASLRCDTSACEQQETAAINQHVARSSFEQILRRSTRVVLGAFAVGIESRGARFEPIAEIQSLLLAYLISAIFTALPRYARIKIFAHPADMQIIVALGTLVLAGQRQ
jgi:hypothetical protein